MGKAEVSHFENDDLLVAATTRLFLAHTTEAADRGQKYLVALSGGRITRKFFAAVAAHASRQNVASVEFFWADERCVPQDHPESNFRLAEECLFSPLGVGAHSIHRIPGELAPAVAAGVASEELVKVSQAGRVTPPMLDLVLLGMGEDGHVASLFPQSSITIADRKSIYVPVHDSPKPPANRVTLGYGPICDARHVWVLATGQGKEAALRDSLSPAGRTPLAQVIENRLSTRILTDILPGRASGIGQGRVTGT